MTRAPAEVGNAANSYEILAKLAMGGMAEIFLARGASTAGVERYVVLKRVLRHRASDVHFVEMFLDEARLAAQLQHPNIAQVYDIGKLGDSYFFTMEYVHGETVRTLLARSHGLRRHIPISSVLSIIAGAAAGLQHAHERKGFDGRHLGIVHRDVSPSNLMVGYEGTVKVVDFGVAKAAHRSTETQSGTVKGKISYMSPEQCKGAEIDRRSDLFSLGIVMWEVLTTEKLFRRTSDFEAMQAIVHDEVPPPSQLRPDVPPELDHIVGRLLAKDPAQRFQTADELHEAIEHAAVRTGSALSAASLGRYMRELFGQRPEPWIELQAAEQHPEPFTVTSEPIPANLALSPAEEFDRKLSAVPPLTQRLAIASESAPPPPPTIPFHVGPELVTTLPAVTPQSGPQYPIATGASHPAFTGMPPSYPVARRPQEEPEPRRSRALIIIAPALVIGVVIGIALALGTSKQKQPATKARDPMPAGGTTTMIATAEQPAAVVPASNPAQLVAAPTPTAAAPAAAAPTAAAPTPTAAAPTPTVPAANAEPKDTPGDLEMPEDNVAAVDMTKPSPKPVAKSKVVDKPKPEDKTNADVSALFKANQFAEVLAACSAQPRLVALNATACTVSACKTKQAAKAKRWFKDVGAARKAEVLETCDGVIPADKVAPPDPCKVDPMACQH
ncbi:MAG TPA: serine/threonine-protein kinase [Kofleriaceae bacterium]